MTPFDPRLPLIAAAAKVKTCHVFHCWQALKLLGPVFNAAHFAAFAGLEEKHVSAILSALESHGAVPKAKTASAPKGARLAADFTMPAEWMDWAIGKRRWTPEDTQTEAENFRDFWVAKPGADAAKLDWRATWQNWVRNSRRPDGDYRPPVEMVAHPDQMERTAAFYEKIGRHTEAAEIRRRLAQESNVIPFARDEPKVAQNRG